MKGWRREERLMWKLVGSGSRKGASTASRAGDVLRRPPAWALIAGAMALTGPRGRRAALRGASCSAVASVIHLPLKRAVRRPRPRGAGGRSIGPLTSSFPSGHTASDLSFLFGAAQELPASAVPLSLATLGSHWSLLRTRQHYPSDIVAGGAIALAVSAGAWRIRPPRAGQRARPEDRLLGIYMTDHLALGVFARELARRARRASEEPALRAALERVAEDGIGQDISLYRQMMGRLGHSPRSPKIALAIAAERIGRAKPNGRLTGRSPLSRFEELDFLVMAIENKIVLWENLRDHAGLRERLPEIDFDRLIDRARAQRAELEPFRTAAGRRALGGPAHADTPAAAPSTA